MKRAGDQFCPKVILVLFRLFYFRFSTCYLLFVLMLASCEFNPDDIQEKYVEKPSEEAPMIEFELSPETDTLRLSEVVKINYKFNASPRKVHWVEFAFDNATLFKREYQLDESLEFDLNPHNYGAGLHHLTITVITSSNSGSIADKIQAEGYSYELKWPVLIDFTPLRSIQILGVTKQTGGTLIRWEKFSHAAFKNYTLEKIPFFENISTNIAVITNPNITSYFDANYLEGEKVYYRIYLSGYPGGWVYYSVPSGPIKASWTTGFKAVVSWEPTQNPSRLDYYRIFQQDRISPESEMHIPFGEKKDIIFDQLALGKNIQINLQNVPKTTNSNFSYDGLEVSSATIAIGDKIPAHEITKKVYGTNYTIFNNENKLVLYNHQTRQRLDSLNFENLELRAYRISPDGKVLYTLSGNTFQAWEIDGFRKLGSVNLLNIHNDLASLSDISVSSDHKILFLVMSQKILVYDFNAQKMLLAPDQNIGWAKISPDGKRVISRVTSGSTSYKCYDIESNQLILKGETVYPGETWGTYFFFSTDIDQLIICHDTEVQVRRSSDFTLINKFTVPSWGFTDFDPETNLLVWGKDVFSPTECSVYKLPTGEILKTLYLSRGNVIVHRDFLIGKNGRQLNLSNL